MISRTRDTFRRLDHWLLTRHPDLWMSRVHYLILWYPLGVGAVILMAYLVPIRTSRVPGNLDEHAPYIFLALAFLAGSWMYWLGRQQSDTPIRVGLRGWTTPLRFGLGLLILMTLSFPYIKTMHTRIGNLVDEEQFLQDNIALRRIGLRVSSQNSGPAFTRRLGLVIGEGTPTVAPDSATPAERSAWVNVVTTYSTIFPAQAEQMFEDFATAERQVAQWTDSIAAIDVQAVAIELRYYEERLWDVIYNLENIAYHKDYGSGRRGDIEDPGVWIYVGLFALYLGFFLYMVTQVSRTVTPQFWIGVVLIVTAVTTAWFLVAVNVEAVESSSKMLVITGLIPYLICGGVVLRTWMTQKTTGMRKGALFLFCALTPLAMFMVWFGGVVEFDWQVGIDGSELDDFDETWEIAKFSTATCLAYLAVLPPLQRIVNRMRALPR